MIKRATNKETKQILTNKVNLKQVNQGFQEELDEIVFHVENAEAGSKCGECWSSNNSISGRKAAKQRIIRRK